MGGLFARFRRRGLYREIRIVAPPQLPVGDEFEAELLVVAGSRGVRVRGLLVRMLFQEICYHEEIADAAEGLTVTTEIPHTLWEGKQELALDTQLEPSSRRSFPLRIPLQRVETESKEELRWTLQVTVQLDLPLPRSKADPHSVKKEHVFR